MAAAVDTANVYSEALDQEDAVFPCKGCGEILEEGKAFELAGNRWHIDCFRCNTCQTLLDSDANLLLLGDGSLICNNCTYSCSACGNKIEDLAILTGNEAFCASCFKCRNCKRKIDNLRYARTSQGIFCMTCHESLMQRRRARAGRGKTSSSKRDAAGSGSYEKRLPELPAKPLASQSAFSPDDSSPASSQAGSAAAKQNDYMSYKHASPSSNYDNSKENLILPSSSYAAESRHVSGSTTIPEESSQAEDFMITLDLDPRAPEPNGQTRSGHMEDFGALLEPSAGRTSSPHRKAPEPRRAAHSPHIAYQEKGRQSSNEMVKRATSGAETPRSAADASPALGGNDRSATSSDIGGHEEDFQLREPPSRRKSGESKKSSPTSPQMSLSGQTEGSQITEQSAGRTLSPPPRRDNYQRSPLSASTDGDTSSKDALAGADSLSKTSPLTHSGSVSRKEVPRNETDLEAAKEEAKRQQQQRDKLSVASTLGGSVNTSRSTLRDGHDEPPPRSATRPSHGDNEKPHDFMAPRIAPTPPALTQRHRANESVGSIQSEHFHSSRDATSPLPPEYALEEAEHPGIFRKMSKAVKHGRSHSDKMNSGPMPSPKWGKSRNGSVDISSPLINDQREDVSSLRSRLKNYEARIAELEAANHALEEKASGTEEIRHVTTEIREKRSTVEFLESQREITFKELDTFMENVSRQKEKPNFDYAEFKENVVQDLREALDRLKSQFESKIRDLVHQKNELTSEITNLIQMKDKGFAEYETLNNRIRENQEIYSRLVESSRDLMEAGKVPTNGSNGLGIQISHNRDARSDGLVDLRTNFKGSDISSGTTLGLEPELETPTVEGVPQLVNLRKGQPKKFNWGRGREKVTKNITKGFRGAFGGSQGPVGDRDVLLETAPYSSIQAGSGPTIGDGPIGQSNSKNAQWMQGGSSKISAPLAPQNSGPQGALFGLDLSQRCERESAMIPAIVLRCAGEIEERGLDVEGIYRKSGAAPDVTKLKNQFEQTDNFDIDPQLDIHAVAGCLKNYFNKLPIPLIPWDSYDPLLSAASIENDDSRRVYELRRVVNSLPSHHRDTLEFLLFHLNQVVAQNKVNLMTITNLAVCFAPTIMRPRQVNRELTDMDIQRKSVELLLKHHDKFFDLRP